MLIKSWFISLTSVTKIYRFVHSLVFFSFIRWFNVWIVRRINYRTREIVYSCLFQCIFLLCKPTHTRIKLVIIHLPDAYQNPVISAHFLITSLCTFSILGTPCKKVYAHSAEKKGLLSLFLFFLKCLSTHVKCALNVNNGHSNSSHLFWLFA